MTLRYYDGTTDTRYCLTTYCSGGRCFATMVNDDLTTEDVFYDDYEDQCGRIGEPKIDCPKDIAIAVREKNVLGKDGCYAEEGDIVEVVKGRKFPKGMKMAVVRIRDGYFSNTYRHHVDMCLVFGSENGYETIDPCNVKIIAIRGGKHNQEEYNDVHDLSVYKNGQEVVA